MVNEFVKIGDLDRTYTTSTHPKLSLIEDFVIKANVLLMAWKSANTSVSILSSAFREVGKMLIKNFIHNEKVRDNIDNYKFYKPEVITQDMKDILMQGHPFIEKFSWNPGSSNTNFI